MICEQTRLPGISVSQVARRYDVNANLVFTWLRDARFAPEKEAASPIEALAAEAHAPPSDGMATFLPVELVGETNAAPSPDASSGPRPTGVMEITLSGGHRLRIEGAYDPGALARFLRALSEPGP
jgi:transposase